MLCSRHVRPGISASRVVRRALTVGDLFRRHKDKGGRVGPLVTKSLVFMGEGVDTNNGGGPPFGGGEKFRAFDKATVRVVWETELEGGTTAPPMTYLWQGTQYPDQRKPIARRLSCLMHTGVIGSCDILHEEISAIRVHRLHEWA